MVVSWGCTVTGLVVGPERLIDPRQVVDGDHAPGGLVLLGPAALHLPHTAWSCSRSGAVAGRSARCRCGGSSDAQPWPFCSTAQPGVTAALQVMMTAAVQSAGVALDDREAVVDEAVRQELQCGENRPWRSFPRLGPTASQGSHAGTPARL